MNPRFIGAGMIGPGGKLAARVEKTVVAPAVGEMMRMWWLNGFWISMYLTTASPGAWAPAPHEAMAPQRHKPKRIPQRMSAPRIGNKGRLGVFSQNVFALEAFPR